MSVSNKFKQITKQIKQQEAELSICAGGTILKEIQFLPVKVFNEIPLYKLKERKEVIAKELKYSFDGQLFKTIMKQIEITVKNANEIKEKDINFKYGLLVDDKYEYIDLGNFFIKDIEDSKKKDEITVTGYDRMIRFMKNFKQSELQLTYPCKMLKLVQRMCEVCGVELFSADFYNADLDVTEDFFTVQELTYRDVLEKIAQATLTTAFIEENKLNLYKVNDNAIEKIDKSYLTDLTIKENFGPVNALVLGRGDVEDNVEEKDQDSIKQNGRCEIRFDENEFIEFQREKVIEGMFEQVKGLEYYSFEASDVGIMWLNPCACIELGDREDNLYKSYYLKANITINTGITSDIEAEIPETTETEYKVTTKEEKKTFSAFLAQDAMKKKINEMVGGEKGQQFITSIISAVSTNPQLAECDNSSIVSAALLGQALNLSPSPQLGQYYMVPFNDSKRGCKVAQFQIGYKGYIQLAIRSGQYKKLNVLAIKEGELKKYDPLNEELEVQLIENEEEREKATTIGYYAMFEYLNGFRKTIYWSKEKMEAHALKYSMGYRAKKGYTFWEKDFDGMAYKTMLRQLISKWGIMSVDLTMQKALESDMAVINDNGTYDYVDNNSNVEDEPIPVETVESENTIDNNIENTTTEDDTDFFFDKK